MKRTTSRAGFTLVEVLVILAILAALAAVLVPTVSNQVRKADLSRVTGDMTNLRTGVEAFLVNVHRYPGDIEDLVYPIDGTDTDINTNTYPTGLQNRWEGPYVDRIITDGGSLETGFASAALSAVLASQYQGSVTLTFNREDLLSGFDLSDEAGVPAGSYDFVTVQLRGETPGGNRLQLEGNAEIGGFFDGRQAVASLDPELSVTPRLLIGGSYSFNDITFDARDEHFQAHIFRGRLETSISTALTFSAFVQYVSTNDAFIANARVRWNPRDGNDLYLVWNEVIDAERAGFPVPPRLVGRTLVAKYTHTFAF